MNTIRFSFKPLIQVGAVAGMLFLTGCMYHGHGKMYGPTGQPGCDGCVQQQVLPPPQPEKVVVRATGYGSYMNPKGVGEERQRFMAMRASKLDALRNLTERVYGTQIFGNSYVKDMVLDNDHLRTVIDAHIRDAKVVSVNQLSSGGFETVVEMQLSPQLSRCLGTADATAAVCQSFMTTRMPVSARAASPSYAHKHGMYFVE